MHGWGFAVLALLVPGILTGCSDCEPIAAADCASVLRFQGERYVEYGAADLPITRSVGSAEQAECSDSGDACHPPQGSYFPADPELVEVFAVPGIPTSRVLVVRRGRARASVLVAESLPPAARERLARRLHP